MLGLFCLLFSLCLCLSLRLCLCLSLCLCLCLSLLVSLCVQEDDDCSLGIPDYDCITDNGLLSRNEPIRSKVSKLTEKLRKRYPTASAGPTSHTHTPAPCSSPAPPTSTHTDSMAI